MVNLKEDKKNTSIFDIDGIPSIGKALPLSMQHVLAMIIGNITPAIIVSNTVNLNAKDRTLLIQVSLLVAAFSTLIQLYPIMKIGARLPVIMGISFAYLPTLIAIGSEYGIKAIYGAQICGAIASIFVGFGIKKVRSIFPPMVAGTVVFTIGLSLYPTAVNYMAGGNGAATYGELKNWAVAIITLITVLVCNQFGKGYFKLASILVGIVVGYIVAFIMGMVDLSSITAPISGVSDIVSIPVPMHFGIEFIPSAIISMVIIYVVNAVQAVGDLSATTMGGLDRQATDNELQGGIVGNGVSSLIAAFFGGLPTATYSQNVGIVATTKVVSRYVLALATGVIFLCGIIPKFGALMTTIPQAVIGGATITVFASITMTGIKLIIQDELSTRNTTIVGLSVALGMGITSVSSDALAYFPDSFVMVFGSSPVVIATLVCIVLNLVLPKKSIADEANERAEIESKK